MEKEGSKICAYTLLIFLFSDINQWWMFWWSVQCNNKSTYGNNSAQLILRVIGVWWFRVWKVDVCVKIIDVVFV